MKNKEMQKAIEFFGIQSELAKLLKVYQSQTYAWLYCKCEIPLKHAVALERLSKGHISALRLKPELLRALRKIDCSAIDNKKSS